MAQQTNRVPNPGTLAQAVRSLQLVWRLLNDPRVPLLTKLIIPAALGYVLFPLDVIPDLIPVLGQIDDIAILFFGIRFFIDMCPPDVVMEHRHALEGRTGAGRGDYVEGTYRVVDDDRSPR